MIETTNLKLKKWQGTDLVTDVLNWYNSNLDSIDANISLIAVPLAATDYSMLTSVKNNWTSLPAGLHMTKNISSANDGCLYYKADNNYGAILQIGHGVSSAGLVGHRLLDGVWIP